LPPAGRALAAALFAAATPAVAQQSPELPARAITAAEPVLVSPFYKGKGPGRGNSYVARFEEDYAYLRDPALANDPFDPVKFLPFDPAGTVYLTLDGETRFRYDNTDHKNFGIATAATPAKPGGHPIFTPATGVSTRRPTSR